MNYLCEECTYFEHQEGETWHRCLHPLLESRKRQILVQEGSLYCDWFEHKENCEGCRHLKNVEIDGVSLGLVCLKAPVSIEGEVLDLESRNVRMKRCEEYEERK
jgi:hypothetical protein